MHVTNSPTSSIRNSHHLFLLLSFTLILITKFVLSETIILDTTKHISLTQQSIYYVDRSQSIVSVNDYLTAFVWRKIFQTNQLDDSLVKSTESMVEFLKEESSRLTIGVEKRLYSEFQSFVSFHNLNLKVHYFTFSGDACRNPKNVLLQYDVLFSTLQYFYDYLRLYRDSDSFVLINPSDFIPLPLVPSILNVISQSELTQLSDLQNLNQLNGFFTLNNYSTINSTNSNEFTIHCSSYIDKDMNNVMARLKLFGNLSNSDLNFINFVSGITLQKPQYWILDEIVKNTLKVYNISIPTHSNNSNETLLELLNNFLPSTCHKCVTTQCVDFAFANGDYWLIPCSIIEIGYFLCLFASQAFRKRSLTRRLLTPYLPIFIVPLEICFSTFMNNACYYFLRYFSMIVVCFIVMNYSLTVVRYYYLRNLYTLITKAEGMNSDKVIHRMRKFSEWKYGLLFTMAIPLVIALIFSIHGVTFFFTDLYDAEFTYLLVGNATIVLYCVLGCLLGFGAIVFDMIVNRKIIKEKGLRRFLLFDDPFLVRIDLLLLVFLIVNTILVIIFYGSGTSEFFIEMSRFFRFLVFVCFMFICGGTVLVSEFIQFIRNAKYGNDSNIQTNSSQFDQLENYLKNSEFQILLKEYASKEMSIENYLLNMDLQKIISKKGIDKSLEIDDLRDLECKYMRSQSIFEVNIQSTVRRNFYELLNECEKSLNDNISNNSNKKTKVRQLVEIIHPPIYANLSDTFLRLASTREFKNWKIAYTIQSNTIN
ncbi:predicted protein [Naegleria gruberi]|uniref:Predicted protein n=1 Tax=Naegleria gruberi TaxID=5762 RepID=D2VZK7_NAEGR|nr:uncharacterized protein NAEGRDRAFT_74523 [Naegleria gruberi]EFC37718.1 predicted protein [Naegleria gruberi]|eukprot:XP_002670462.1 predicted protein [Naegleria gruberi strain NEG-M]